MTRNLFILFLSTTLLLSACAAVATPADPLEGTSWELVSSAGQAVLPGTQVTLAFAEGRASGTAGCNGYGGMYQVDGDQVAFREVASTLMFCADPAGVMEQETAFLGSLNEVARFELAAGRLQLFRADGEALEFVPAR